MTEKELRAEADRIAALRADPRTAAVVRRAFLSDGAMTLRRYLALEEASSPLLSGSWSWSDPAAFAQEICTAWEILFPERELPSPDHLDTLLRSLIAERERAFSTWMRMRWPVAPGAAPRVEPHDGVGWVPRVLARALAAEIPDPLDVPMDRLFVLLAGASANEGAESQNDYREVELGLPCPDGTNPENDKEPERRAEHEQCQDQGEFDRVHD